MAGGQRTRAKHRALGECVIKSECEAMQPRGESGSANEQMKQAEVRTNHFHSHKRPQIRRRNKTKLLIFIFDTSNI